MNTSISISSRLRARYAEVPSNFPRPKIKAMGLQPLFSSIAYEGRYYSPGCTPPDLYAHWRAFEEIAHRVAKQAANKQKSAISVANVAGVLLDILELYFPQKYFSLEEMQWLERRIYELLGWEMNIKTTRFQSVGAS